MFMYPFAHHLLQVHKVCMYNCLSYHVKPKPQSIIEMAFIHNLIHWWVQFCVFCLSFSHSCMLQSKMEGQYSWKNVQSAALNFTVPSAGLMFSCQLWRAKWGSTSKRMKTGQSNLKASYFLCFSNAEVHSEYIYSI